MKRKTITNLFKKLLNSVNPEENYSEDIIDSVRLFNKNNDDKKTFLSLENISRSLDIDQKELEKIFISFGWIKKNSYFRWEVTQKAKDLGTIEEEQDARKEKIWPKSILNNDDLLNVSNNFSSENTVDELSIDDISSSEFDHESTFRKYFSLLYNQKIDESVIENVIDIYYELYDPDGPNKVYELYYDKYIQLFDVRDYMQEYFSFFDDEKGTIDNLSSDMIIKIIDEHNALAARDKSYNREDDKEIDFVSMEELAENLNMSYNETLSLLLGMNFIEPNEEGGWNITATAAAENLGVEEDENDMKWEDKITTSIEKKASSIFMEIFQEEERIITLLKGFNDNEKKELIDALEQVIDSKE